MSERFPSFICHSGCCNLSDFLLCQSLSHDVHFCTFLMETASQNLQSLEGICLPYVIFHSKETFYHLACRRKTESLLAFPQISTILKFLGFKSCQSTHVKDLGAAETASLISTKNSAYFSYHGNNKNMYFRNISFRKGKQFNCCFHTKHLIFAWKGGKRKNTVFLSSSTCRSICRRAMSQNQNQWWQKMLRGATCAYKIGGRTVFASMIILCYLRYLSKAERNNVRCPHQ